MDTMILLGLAILTIVFFQNRTDWIDDAQHKNNTRFEYLNKNIIEASKARKIKEQQDKEKAERLERYRKFREGKEPTFEEWKTAREAEQKDKKSDEDNAGT